MVPLLSPAIGQQYSFCHIHRRLFSTDGSHDDGYVITWKGKPIKSLKTAFNSAKRRAGVGGRKIPIYSLRHAFVTALLHQGVDLRTVADISGHDVGTMLKHYAHSMDAGRKDAISKLPSFDTTKRST